PALRCERAHDPGARGSVAGEIAFRVLLDHDLALVRPPQRDCAFDLADEPMIRLDAAVADADPDPGAGRTAQGPFPRDALRPFDADPDLRRSCCGQAPGRQGLAGIPLGLRL